MTTTKPRIAITVEPEHYEILRKLAELQERPMSRIVSELVGEMAPVLGQIAETMELAMRARSSAKESIRKALDQAEAEILPHAEAVLRQYEAFEVDVRQLALQIEDVKGGEGTDEASAAGTAVPSNGEDPRPVITGVRRGQRKAKGEAKKAGLEPGQRVRMKRSGRTGDVVKVYPDGSAAIHWDHGEPQGEGLAHERVPAKLLAVMMGAGQ